MTSYNSSSSRIAKNTLFLYIRMLFIILIKLYTSRVILEVLGVSDYGIYTVVGGVVVMFSILTNSLSTAISRYLTFSLGGEDLKTQLRVFSTSMSIIIVICIIIVIIIELIAPWFMTSYLNIPEGRMYAAKWCLHCSIITFGIGLLSVPYNAAIIAHERMGAYAYISILEVILQLGVVLSLSYYGYDKLILYGVLMTFVAVLIRIIYGIYCQRNFEECRYKILLDKKLAKEIFGFTSWSLLGNGSYLLNTQGINIVMNIFFGVTINAARGIADQIQAAMMQFLSSFTTAINPQIVKSYAAGDISYVNELVCKGAKFSFYLSLLMAVPLLLETDNILLLWLGEYPDHTSAFVRLSIIATMIDFMGNTTARAVWATGKVKRYYIITSCLSLLVLPVSWLCYKLSMAVETAYIVFIIIYLILIPTRLLILKSLMDFSPRYFVKNALVPILPVTLISIIAPIAAHNMIDASFLRLLVVVLLTACSLAISVYLIGITTNEREYVNMKLSSLINCHKK